jgi:hypothetical protein
VRASEQVRSVQVLYKASTTGTIKIMVARVFLCRCVCSVAVVSSHKTARQLNLYIVRAGLGSGLKRNAPPVATSVLPAPAVGGSAPPIGGSATGGSVPSIGGSATGGSAPSHGGDATGGSAPDGGGGVADDSASHLLRATRPRQADFYDKLAH